MNRRTFAVRIVLGALAGVVAAKDAFAEAFDFHYNQHIPPERYRNRLQWNIHERIWLKMWERENNPPSYLNHGIGPLEHCLDREPTPGEVEAVAGVIQWFGTNCGHGFLVETLEAQGYRVREDDKLPNRAVIKKYTWDWQRGPLPKKIAIDRRGQKFFV